MVQAYILIQTEVGKAAEVAAEVSRLPGVASAEDVTGPYDVIVRAEAADMDQLGQLVVAGVQRVEGITRTLTCPVVHLT
jgi:DNA-binding Lrp family transcriptional regulator